jgi:DNA-binding GntR family transcriptional regulator
LLLRIVLTGPVPLPGRQGWEAQSSSAGLFCTSVWLCRSERPWPSGSGSVQVQTDGIPPRIVTYAPPTQESSYPAIDYGRSDSPRDDRHARTMWRVVEETGNCCENYVTITPDGRLMDFGGTYVNVTGDRGKTPIVNGYYPPGERLREERLAEDFGVSRNPVREALRVVEAEGFIAILPRRGAIVRTPDLDSAQDMFLVRGRLETLAARLAAERATPEDVASLRELLSHAREATDAEDFVQVSELNSALHLRVIKISGNRWLASIATSLYLHVQWVFRISAADRAPHSWAEHTQLVDAIAAGDPEAAEAAARTHVHRAGAAASENVRTSG